MPLSHSRYFTAVALVFCIVGSMHTVSAQKLDSVPKTVAPFVQGPPVGKQVSFVCRLPAATYASINQPLYVVDGKLSDSTVLHSLSPNNIEAVQVLKGKEAVAIYGTAGMNGVIIITTKKTGKTDSLPQKSTPGPAPLINIRGLTDTIGIVYVLNGQVITKAQYQKVSPNNIKSISVLKDDTTGHLHYPHTIVVTTRDSVHVFDTTHVKP